MTDEDDQHAPGGGLGGGPQGRPRGGHTDDVGEGSRTRPVVHGTRAAVLALVVNVAVAVATAAGFVVTGSSSVLAASAHSFAGAGGLALLLRGGRHTKEEADDGYRVERGREGYFWGCLVAIVSFSTAVWFALHEAVDALDHRDAIDDPGLALGILGVAAVVQLLTFRTALGEARQVRGTRGYRRFIRRAETPELPFVLVQGLAAVVGTLVALGGVGLTVLTDDGRWDGFATLGIGILLAVTAVVLALVTKSLMIGQGATTREAEALRAALTIDPDVVRIVHLHTRYLGPDELVVGARIELQHDLSLVEGVHTVHRLRRQLRAAVSSARHVYLEPDVHQDHRAGTAYVVEHSGHIDPDDPMYAVLTGRPLDPDDDIWTE